MTNEQREIKCPCCGRYLGTIVGEFFRAAPCACGWQLQLTKVRKLPRNVDKLTISN